MDTVIKSNQKAGFYMNLATGFGLLLVGAFIAYGISQGIFQSEEAMEAFLKPMGLLAPLLFLVIQAVQVVLPILPGAIGCMVGVMIWGPVGGFALNYIGISIGSVGAFLLARKYGQPLVRSIASEKIYNKYIGWLKKGKKFDRCFAAAIFFPVAPDDFLCYLAGLTEMSLKKFVAVILLGKPCSIALYSMGIYAAFQWILE